MRIFLLAGKIIHGGMRLPSWTAEPSSAPVSVLDVTPSSAIASLQMSVLGAITSVKAVLPDMLARGSGTLFFTTGISAIVPLPSLGNAGIAMAGLRNYAYTLYEALADRGIYVGTLCIGTRITKGDPQNDPDFIAARIYEMCEQRDGVEETFPRDIAQAFNRSPS